MYKIYFNRYIFNLISCEKAVNIKLLKNEIMLNENQVTTFQELLKDLNSQHKITKIFVTASNSKKLFRKLFRETLLIKAGGGLVTNIHNELLMIKRHGKWDLPKGKVEKGEKISTTAIREVEEECGIKNLEITQKIMPTFHVYFEKNKWIIKKSCWYKMFTTDVAEPVPQTKENITEAVWLGKTKVKNCMDNAFDNIKDIVQKYYL